MHSSESSLNSGVQIPASMRHVRRFLTERDRERVHWHAAVRTPLLSSAMAEIMCGKIFESMTCLRDSSLEEQTAARARSPASLYCACVSSAMTSGVSFAIASASHATFCSSSESTIKYA
jgi:hypothetical protein